MENEGIRAKRVRGIALFKNLFYQVVIIDLQILVKNENFYFFDNVGPFGLASG